MITLKATIGLRIVLMAIASAIDTDNASPLTRRSPKTQPMRASQICLS